MKNILERFEKLAAAHGLNADCATAMRGLLNDAHSTGYSAHMAVVSDIDADEDSLPGTTGRDDEEEPDDDEKEEATLRALTKAVRKELRKTLKKEVRKAVQRLQRIAPLAQ
jgi:hypothetical protein